MVCDSEYTYGSLEQCTVSARNVFQVFPEGHVDESRVSGLPVRVVVPLSI